MWSLAWWWVLLALPLPWLLRRLQEGRRLESGAALAVDRKSTRLNSSH